jgi:hypothetical protein
MKTILPICFFVISFINLSGQNSDIVISGEFDKTPFVEFFKEIEKTTDAYFYYRYDWIKDITISFSGTNVLLSKVLADNLEKQGLHFYNEEDNNFYIFPGPFPVTELPVYRHHYISDLMHTDTKDSITDTEKKYLEGRMIASIEIITVGDKEKSTTGKTCIVNGKIREKATGEPLIGATIFIEELKLGTVTDLDGQFKLALPKGKYKAIFNYMSMKKKEYYLQVYSSGTITIEMEKELIEIHEVTVTANRFDNVNGMQMGFERVSAKTIKEIPLVMGEKDLIKVAQMLPGVQNVGEGSSGFNVRGSAADQNMFYINRVPVYNTSHLFGFFTSFSPDIIKDFSLYKSNIPAKFGGRLASIFDISTRQGNKKKFFAKGGISPVTGHIMIEGPLKKDFNSEEAGKTSFVTSWRSTYSNWILERIEDYDIQNSKAFFYDATLSLNTEINDKNLIKIFGYTSADQFTLYTKNDYSYSNIGALLSWKHLFPSSITGNFSLVFSRYLFSNTDKNEISESYTHTYYINHYEAHTDFTLVTPSNHNIEFGSSAIFYDLNRGDIIPYGEESLRITSFLGKEKGIEGAVYISDEYQVFQRLSLLGGIRYSFFGQLGPADINEYFSDSPKNKNNIRETNTYDNGQLIKFYSGPELRGAFNYRTGNNSSVKLSYNRLRQYIFMLSNTIAISPNDQWKLCDYHISPAISDQVSLGFYKDFPKKAVMTSIEVYRKWIDNIVEYKDGADFISSNPVEMQVLQGKQNTWGVEFMLRKNAGKLTGWLSYTYSRSLIIVNSEHKENQINNGIEYPSNYDRPHSLNYISNYRLGRRLSISTNIVYSTGRPITYPISIYYSEGQQFMHFSERNKYRIPDYFRIDLSVNLEGNLKYKKLTHSYWMLNVYNLLGRKNAYSVYYEAEDGIIKGYRLSIFARPIVTLSWNFKFGNYSSE